MPAPTRAQDGGGVDHIGNPRNAAELTRCACSLIVERFDFDPLRTEQASQASLTTPIAPYPTNDSGRYRQRVADLQGTGKERNDCPNGATRAFRDLHG